MRIRALRPAAALVAAVLILGGCTSEKDPATVGPTECPTDGPCPDPLSSVTPSATEWREIHGVGGPAVQEVAAAVVDGEIYIVGGLLADSNATDMVQSYDPTEDAWTLRPPLPVKIHHAMAAEHDGKLIVIGGFAGDLRGGAIDRVFILDGDRWTEGPRLRRPRAAGAAATVRRAGEDRVVVVGGISAGTHVGPVEIFDGTSWRDGAPIPSLRDHVGAASDGQFVYVAGGRRSGGHFDTFEGYDPENDRWDRLADMPTARSGLGAAIAGRSFFAVGGEGPRIFPEVEEYDVDSGRWQRLPDLKIPVHGVGVAVVGDNLYAIAGGFVVGLKPTVAAQVLRIG